MSIVLKPRASPKTKTRKDLILEVLEAGNPDGMTAREIGAELVSLGAITEDEQKRVCPRLTELRNEGAVLEAGRRMGPNGHRTTIWRLAT